VSCLVVSQDPNKFLGVACMAALATDRTRRGSNRAFVATYSADTVMLHKLFLEKGRRDRVEEDAVASRSVCIVPCCALLHLVAPLDTPLRLIWWHCCGNGVVCFAVWCCGRTIKRWG